MIARVRYLILKASAENFITAKTLHFIRDYFYDFFMSVIFPPFLFRAVGRSENSWGQVVMGWVLPLHQIFGPSAVPGYKTYF